MEVEPTLATCLLQEALACAERLAPAAAREPFRVLAADLEHARISDPSLEIVGRVLELSLSSGRLRQLYGPHVEMQALRLYERTPQGQDLLQRLAQANRSLEALSGHVLQRVQFSLHRPGSYYLTLHTDHCVVRLVIDRLGVSVESLETAG
ncbi:MAG: hypothetical protein C4297_08880 [Gemmataceae bacterium]